MTQQAYPTVNEFAPSWSDIKITIPIYSGPTVNTDDIAAIKWSDKVTVGVVKGTSGGAIRARTVGELESDASLTLYLAGWRKLSEALATINKSITLVAFDVAIQYTPPGSTEIFDAKIIGARVVGRTFDASEGPDAQKIEVPLHILRVEEGDGVRLL